MTRWCGERGPFNLFFQLAISISAVLPRSTIIPPRWELCRVKVNHFAIIPPTSPFRVATQRGGNNLKKRNTNYRKALFFSTSTRAGEVVENYPDMDYLRARHYRIEFSRPFPELHRMALKLMLTLWNSIKTVDKSPTTDPP